MSTDLRQLIQPALARARTAAAKRDLAARLRDLADEIDDLAAADERIGHRVRADAIAAERRTGRPRGRGPLTVRFSPAKGEGSAERRSGRLFISKSLWLQLGEPERVQLQRNADRLIIRPTEIGGFGVTGARDSTPRLSIGADRARDLRLQPGEWPARIENGAIIVETGAKL
jgi:hypothetical protein